MDSINDRLLAELNSKDDLAFKLGETLDVKASIGLVVITFLGTQTAYLLDKHVTGVFHALQDVLVIFLVIATIMSIVELWPRDYIMMLNVYIPRMTRAGYFSIRAIEHLNRNSGLQAFSIEVLRLGVFVSHSATFWHRSRFR